MTSLLTSHLHAGSVGGLIRRPANDITHSWLHRPHACAHCIWVTGTPHSVSLHWPSSSPTHYPTSRLEQPVICARDHIQLPACAVWAAGSRCGQALLGLGLFWPGSVFLGGQSGLGVSVIPRSAPCGRPPRTEHLTMPVWRSGRELKKKKKKSNTPVIKAHGMSWK